MYINIFDGRDSQNKKQNIFEEHTTRTAMHLTFFFFLIDVDNMLLFFHLQVLVEDIEHVLIQKQIDEQQDDEQDDV